MTKRHAELTFKHNLKQGRHGWLRLTPAYSIKIVEEILARNPTISFVLDPFSGTGTTGLVCAEAGIRCDLFDLNPFLGWLATVKTTNYTSEQLQTALAIAEEVVEAAKRDEQGLGCWVPAISNISRWWPERELQLLASLYQKIVRRVPHDARFLLLVSFCRLLMEWSNAAFNHQSMSFKQPVVGAATQSLFSRLDEFRMIVHEVVASARKPLTGQVSVRCLDARHIPQPEGEGYDCVITSPPYPNRISYIRELRPYMYWLGFLENARDAGELDWQAIGGTWGIATSRLQHWQPSGEQINYPGFYTLIGRIAENSQLLANYVHKYFVDIRQHLESLFPAVRPGASIFYVVGNSKFYDTVVPVEGIYAQLLHDIGFENVKVETLRKRNSKKELFEFLVSARRPGASTQQTHTFNPM